MRVVYERPSASYSQTLHEDIWQDAERIKSLIAELSEIDDEDSSLLPAPGSGTVRRMVTDLIGRFHKLYKIHEDGKASSQLLSSRSMIHRGRSRIPEYYESLEQSLYLLIELLGSGDRPDSTNWSEIERWFAFCESSIRDCLAADNKLFRQGLKKARWTATPNTPKQPK